MAREYTADILFHVQGPPLQQSERLVICRTVKVRCSSVLLFWYQSRQSSTTRSQFPSGVSKKGRLRSDRASKLGRQSCRQQCQSTLVDGKVVFDNARFLLIKRLRYHMA